MYIGDLSREDAKHLIEYSRGKDVLEFGVGGSTQIFTKYANSVDSFDTSKEWIDKTKNRIRLLGIEGNVKFFDYSDSIPNKEYDIIFDDGIDAERLPFALMSWQYLKQGGILIYHDGKRDADVSKVAEFYKQRFKSIERIFPLGDSNLIGIVKGKKTPYKNWNIEEGKLDFEWGWGEPDKRFYGKVGVAISTTDKRHKKLPEVLSLFNDYIYGFRDIELIVVNDKDYEGIAKTKNRCIRQLYDLGCDYFFLFDDDVYLKKEGLIDKVIRAYIQTGIPHFLYMRDDHHKKVKDVEYKLSNVFNTFDKYSVYSMCSGIMLFMTREVVDTVGGFDERFDTYGYEHAEYSRRIYKKFLNDSNNFYSLEGLSEYITAPDFDKNEGIDNPQNLSDEQKRTFVNKNSSLYNHLIQSNDLFKSF